MRLVAAAFVLTLSPSIGQEHGKPTSNKQDDAKCQSSNTAITAVNASPAEQDENQADTQSNKRPPSWDIYWPTVGLVILGAIGALIAIRTLQDLQRQTKATEQAASAAHKAAVATKIYAEAVINSERAWIVAELKPEALKDKKTLQWRKAEDGQALKVRQIIHGEHLYYSLFVMNIGRTPAQLLSFSVNYTCLPEGVTDLDPQITPDYSMVHEFIHLLPRDTGIEILAKLDTFTEMEGSWSEIQALKKTAVFHGWVKYRNIFGLPEECRSDFCYVYTVSEERLTAVGRHTRHS
jgi:hypothetical protein